MVVQTLKLSPVGMLLALWLLQVAVLALLQMLGLNFGFKVWHIGEDLNWIAFMLDGSGASVAQQLWKVDGRNPLSPWWYVAAEPLIRASPYGLHVVSQLIYPCLAACVYLLVDRLAMQQAKLFAFCVSAVVLLWTFTGRFDHVQWNMFGAVGCTLLSIYFYCGFVDGGRTESHRIVLSLLFYLVALSTYTLQSGAIVAVAFLALLRSDEPPKRRLVAAAFDISAFLAIFLWFNLIWITTTPMPANSFHSFEWSLFLRKFGASVHYFLAPPIFEAHWQDVQRTWSAAQIGAVFFLTFLVLGTFFKRAGEQLSADGPSRRLLGWVTVALLAIAGPTLILEATNTTWVPGTRSLMVQPIFQPLLYVSLIFVSALLFAPRLRKPISLAMVAALASCVFVAAMGYNNRQVALTRSQRALADVLRQIPLPPGQPITFIVKYANYKQPYIATEPTWGHAIQTYGRAVFGRGDIQVRTIRYGNAALPDSGCGNATVSFVEGGVEIDGKKIPEAELMVLLFDGKRVSRIEQVGPSDFENLCVVWSRRSGTSVVPEKSQSPGVNSKSVN